MTRPVRLAICVVAVFLVSGCGSSAAAPAARAGQLQASIAQGDAVAACATLAPSTRSTLEQEEQKSCRDTILDQGLPSAKGRALAKVYGSMAQVTYENETVFLSRYANGWRVIAAGCTPVTHDRPYECTLTAD